VALPGGALLGGSCCHPHDEGVGCAKCAARHTSIAEALVRSELRTFLPSILQEGRRIDASPVGVTKRTMWPEIDIVVPDLRIAIEYDGSYHHRDRIAQDRRKSELLQRLGWQVIRIRTGDLRPITDLDVVADDPRHQPDPSIPVTVAQVLRRVEQITDSVIVGLDDYEQQGAFADPAAVDHLVRTMPRSRSRRAVLEVAPQLPPRDAWRSDDFPDVVRARRLSYGHTLVEAAAAMGLAALQVRKYEAGTAKPRLKRTTDALQDYLDLDATTFRRLLGRPLPGAGHRAPRPLIPPPARPDPSTWESLGLGGTLRALRRSRQQTQSDVAAAVGVHFGALSVWELGTAIPRDPSVIGALEDHFEVARGSLTRLVPDRERRLGRRVSQAGGGRIAELEFDCPCEQPSPGDFGHLIEHRRLEQVLSQEQLASLLATTQGVVSRWERGDAEPLLDSMVRLSAVLEVPLRALLAAHPVYGQTSPFGGLVLAARAERRMKQAELARQVGCSQATISKWERGTSHPWPTQFEAISAALELPLETVRSVVPYRRPGPPAGEGASR
jgi:transcriptional regulator with XRE-family HTH domain